MIMRILIITLHSIYNPGSALQAYGLQQFLLQEGYNAEIIDYRPMYSTIGKNKLKGIIRKIMFFRNEKKIKKRYNEFVSNNLILTKKYRTYSQLLSDCPKADVYIAGSDQLWNMSYDCGKDDSYYLKFVTNGRKLSYATSIGKRDISEIEVKRIQELTSDYYSISVREKSTGITLSKRLQREIKWVCDPVFLLPKTQYEKMTKKILMEPYAVIYLSAESDLLEAVIRDIREKLRCKIVLLGGNRVRCDCDIHIKDAGPEEFLSLLKYAEIVVSSSFHATAFSLIFHKKFGVILPKGNGERIESLLELSELKSRIIGKEEDFSGLYSKIEYDTRDRFINSFVCESKDYLLRSLND
ncbi:MAG: polysaccharide pyruvyl transferase family protein [Paludibacteraceae bacterium]|nr:polysaccharide pyruvyl transferase family protein [Paludibacteraceae bacterium]